MRDKVLALHPERPLATWEWANLIDIMDMWSDKTYRRFKRLVEHMGATGELQVTLGGFHTLYDNPG